MFFNTENKRSELDGTSGADEFSNPGKIFLLLPICLYVMKYFHGDDRRWEDQARHLHWVFGPGEWILNKDNFLYFTFG